MIFTSLVNTVIGLDLLASGGEVGIELLNEGVITPTQYIDAVQTRCVHRLAHNLMME